MIAAKESFPKLTPEEYFAWEEEQLEKHEYFDGAIYLLGDKYNSRTSSSRNHSLITVSLINLLFDHLNGEEYQISNRDLKVKTIDGNKYIYPDIAITGDKQDQESTEFITYPCLVIEVLSKSTEAYDRGDKFKLYRKNPMLIDYLLVSSTSIEIDLYYKEESGKWMIQNYQEGDILELKSINLSFPIESIYRGLTLSD